MSTKPLKVENLDSLRRQLGLKTKAEKEEEEAQKKKEEEDLGQEATTAATRELALKLKEEERQAQLEAQLEAQQLASFEKDLALNPPDRLSSEQIEMLEKAANLPPEADDDYDGSEKVPDNFEVR